MRYQTLRSVSDHHVFVLLAARARAPSRARQGMHRGELADLAMPYLLDIEEQGFSLARCELAVFKPGA